MSEHWQDRWCAAGWLGRCNGAVHSSAADQVGNGQRRGQRSTLMQAFLPYRPAYCAKLIPHDAQLPVPCILVIGRSSVRIRPRAQNSWSKRYAARLTYRRSTILSIQGLRPTNLTPIGSQDASVTAARPSSASRYRSQEVSSSSASLQIYADSQAGFAQCSSRTKAR
jgi:hypothetical protein